MIRRVSARIGGAAIALAMAVLLATLVPTAGATILGSQRAGRLVVHQINRRFPAATQVFVNCPPGNDLPPAEDKHGDEHVATGCEFRFVVGARAIKGEAAAGEIQDQSGIQYFLADFQTGAPAPLAPRRCRPAPPPEERHLKVTVRGETCEGAEEIVGELGAYARDDKNYRIPGHLSIGEDNGLEDGFVTRLYQCRGRSYRAGGGGARPHIREVATCRTRLGDQIEYWADQYY